jgi:hypothetical protein
MMAMTTNSSTNVKPDLERMRLIAALQKKKDKEKKEAPGALQSAAVAQQASRMPSRKLCPRVPGNGPSERRNLPTPNAYQNTPKKPA